VKHVDENGSMVFCKAIDEHGNAVKRTMESHPYTYDGFVLWRGIQQSELSHTLYSDRLRTQYRGQWDELLKKHFSNISDNFDNRNPQQVEKFLQELLGKPNYKLGLIMQYCNQSNGFPVWRFDIKVETHS